MDGITLYRQSLGIFTFHEEPTFVALRPGQLIRDVRSVSFRVGESEHANEIACHKALKLTNEIVLCHKHVILIQNSRLQLAQPRKHSIVTRPFPHERPRVGSWLKTNGRMGVQELMTST